MIQSADIKSIQRKSSILVALVRAITEAYGEDADKSPRGRKAMERIGAFVLATVKRDDAKVPFWNVETMHAYVNACKVEATSNINAETGIGGFLGKCADAKWHAINGSVVTNAEAFQAKWKAIKSDLAAVA